MKRTTEKQVEQYLRDSVISLGGLCLKWVSPGQRGVPDRIVLIPSGRIAFVEVKNDAGKPTELQTRMLEKLTDRGFIAAIVHNRQEVDAFLCEVKRHAV